MKQEVPDDLEFSPMMIEGQVEEVASCCKGIPKAWTLQPETRLRQIHECMLVGQGLIGWQMNRHRRCQDQRATLLRVLADKFLDKDSPCAPSDTELLLKHIESSVSASCLVPEDETKSEDAKAK